MEECLKSTWVLMLIAPAYILFTAYRKQEDLKDYMRECRLPAGIKEIKRRDRQAGITKWWIAGAASLLAILYLLYKIFSLAADSAPQ